MIRSGIRTMASVASKENTKVINSGLILSRIPIVTPDLTEFEKKYYNYQSELEKRLMWTFPYYFYFRKGTLAERRFLKAQKYPVSKQPGVWYPKGIPDIRQNRERRSKQDVILPKEQEDINESLEKISRPVVPNPRTTKADETGDLTSLERKLSRTLYLLLKNKTGEWEFPTFQLKEDDALLHLNAETGLRTLGGKNINTWTVSKTPVAAYENNNGSDITFFIKSHILGGKFDLQENDTYSNFAWLTKDEVKNHIKTDYFNKVDCLLSKV
ncbi:hypothetical protein TBLA_0A05700 [Henningerozyma blattae CBS 6284]|uniref:Large ribosomal subunit protein mL46 n=1 Tax=Henningerozyma blattae (strain ATCC 34711 / CBS 6284 / DSM 70876 / NBRC 10599 / NRRL Y-10934 / UCD 77-7) TaxID=1071380 RepID=I2GW61_HENB6|nr:hypothetical protein TBLA_0A05700 [Tetrapisispora blattae CBS 6284]CCH58363.1 hypothetical protein TBLA_0A05700 [Tetrapisispora blattae CBS 6284]